MLTPDRIIDAALAAIDESGVEKLSLRGVTDRLGVTPPAIYDHFRGKAALLMAVTDRVYHELAEELRAQHGSARERAIGGFRAYIAYARAHPRRYGLLLRYPPPAISIPGADAPESAADAYDVGADAVFAADPSLSPLVAWAMAHGISTLLVNAKLDDVAGDQLVEQAVEVVFR